MCGPPTYFFTRCSSSFNCVLVTEKMSEMAKQLLDSFEVEDVKNRY